MFQSNHFLQNLATGKQGEKQMILFFTCWGYNLVQLEQVDHYKKTQNYRLIVDVSDHPYYRKKEIDLLLYDYNSPDPDPTSLEVKNQPSALKSRNLFCQTTNRQGDPGWVFKSKADYFAFIIPNSEILLVERSKLLLLALIRTDQFTWESMDNRESALLIPVDKVRNICDPDKIIPIPKLG